MSDRLISQLAHVELLTPKLEESARFFTNVLGLNESARDGDSVYLRCWSDFFFHSVQLACRKATWPRAVRSSRKPLSSTGMSQ